VDRGWARNIARGKAETDTGRAQLLLAEIRRDHVSQPEEFVGDLQPLQVDERELILARAVQRVGQGTFRARLLDGYDRRCAITGERWTEQTFCNRDVEHGTLARFDAIGSPPAVQIRNDLHRVVGAVSAVELRPPTLIWATVL
jgi:hypothetical protein